MRSGATVSFPKRNARKPFSCAGWRPNPSRIATRELFPGGNGDGYLCALPPSPTRLTCRPVFERGAHFYFHAEPSRCPARQTNMTADHGASYVGPSSVFRRRRVFISFSCDISHVCAGVRVTLVDSEHPATIATRAVQLSAQL